MPRPAAGAGVPTVLQAAKLRTLLLSPLALGLTLACNTQLGQGGTMVQGSGGGAGAQAASGQLIRCQRPVGTAALIEPPHNVHTTYGLSSPVPVVKLLMAQSGCFRVVNRGAASSALQRERALARGGELQKGSGMGGGQMVAADFLITPSLVHQDRNAGGFFGGAGGLIPGPIGAVAGGIKSNNLEAQVLLDVTNVRSGVQEGIAEGSARKSDLDFGGLGWLGYGAGGGGAYSDTEVGKIVAAAFMDAHNTLVVQLGAIPLRDGSEPDYAGYVTSAGVNFRSGPSTDAPVLQSLPAGTALSPTGREQGSWWEVEARGHTGWIHSNYITR